MTDQKREEIKRLAGIEHEARLRFEAFGYFNMNHPDPEFVRKTMQDRAVAEAEYLEAADKLRRAVQP